MPERGPAQLLLLFSRRRARPGWRLGLAVAFIALLGLVPGEEGVLHKAKTGLTQSFRQAAWKHALAGEPEQKPWPWDDTLPAANSVVPRLGLSAAVLYDVSGQRSERAPLSGPVGSSRTQVVLDRRDPHLDLGDVAIGDRITVTTADGRTQAYQVTGRQLVDGEGSAADASPAAGASVPRDTCPPPNSVVAGVLRIIIEAVHLDRAKPATSDEQKL